MKRSGNPSSGRGRRGFQDWVIGITIPAAQVDERDSTYAVLRAIEGLVRGDQGFIRSLLKEDDEALGIDLPTPVRKTMTEQRPRWWLKRLPRVRQRLDTVISQLEHRLGLANTRACDAWHLTHRVTRKLLAPTVGVWLNVHPGREPLRSGRVSDHLT